MTDTLFLCILVAVMGLALLATLALAIVQQIKLKEMEDNE